MGKAMLPASGAVAFSKSGAISTHALSTGCSLPSQKQRRVDDHPNDTDALAGAMVEHEKSSRVDTSLWQS